MVDDVFKRTIRDYELLKKKDSLILGVSGGPDSVCMLHQFLRIKDEYRLNLVCAHFNHSLRKEADIEEEFVKNMCKEKNLKFISEKKDVRKFFKGDSLEQTARFLRFDFFLKCSRHYKIKKLALAHHKDDLAETVLMRLIRGSGLKGLRGFLPKSKFKGITVIRPFIETSKDQILNWLKRERVSYCIDKSNLSAKFLRNRLRSKLLPMLKEMNPNIVDSLYNTASNLAYDYDFIYSLSNEKFLSLKKRETKSAVALSLEGLRKLPSALLNNVIRIAIEELKGSTRRIESRHLREIRDLIVNRPSGSIVHLPFLLVKKEDKSLLIEPLDFISQ